MAKQTERKYIELVVFAECTPELLQEFIRMHQLGQEITSEQFAQLQNRNSRVFVRSEDAWKRATGEEPQT